MDIPEVKSSRRTREVRKSGGRAELSRADGYPRGEEQPQDERGKEVRRKS
jgi:hypothetical protein